MRNSRLNLIHVCLFLFFLFCFVYVHILFMLIFLLPSQPNGVMSSMVSLPNHAFTGQA